jgi:hypothetical protein
MSRALEMTSGQRMEMESHCPVGRIRETEGHKSKEDSPNRITKL